MLSDWQNLVKTQVYFDEYFRDWRISVRSIDVCELLWNFRYHGHCFPRFRRNVETQRLVTQRLSFNDKDCHCQHIILFHIFPSFLLSFFHLVLREIFGELVSRCEHTFSWLTSYNTVSYNKTCYIHMTKENSERSVVKRLRHARFFKCLRFSGNKLTYPPYTLHARQVFPKHL